MQDDIAAMLRALGIGDHARFISPHAVVVDEIIPAITALRAPTSPRPADQLAPDERYIVMGHGVRGVDCLATSGEHEGYFAAKSGEGPLEVLRQALTVARLTRRNAEDAAKSVASILEEA